MVRGRQPVRHVGHKHNHVGIGHGHFRLFLHPLVDVALRLCFQTSGVDENEAVIVPPDLAHQPVPRGPGDVGHDGLAAAQNPVKQGRFAYIGPPYDSNDGQG